MVKRIILLFLIIAALLVSSSCQKQRAYSAGYGDGYHKGYDDGVADGILNGKEKYECKYDHDEFWKFGYDNGFVDAYERIYGEKYYQKLPQDYIFFEGMKDTMIYHNGYSPCMDDKYGVFFDTEKEAKAAGYKPCKKCVKR